MSDLDLRDQRADDESARDGADDTTDEQLWKEASALDKGSPADDGGAAENEDETDREEPDAADDGGDEGDPDGEAEASGSSEDGEDRDGDDAGEYRSMDRTELQEQIERLQHALNSEKGRTAASRREIESLNRQLGAARDARHEKDETRLRERRKQIETAKEEYGDVVGPLADHITELEGRLDELSRQEQRDLEAARQRRTEILDEQWGVFTSEHPEGLRTVEEYGDVFNAWIEDQPKRLRDIYDVNRAAIVDGNGAALLVSLFKEALADAEAEEAGETAGHAPDDERLQARRERQLRGARSTRSGTPQKATGYPNKDADDPEGHWRWAAEMERRTGA